MLGKAGRLWFSKPFWLSQSARTAHLYTLGKTGKGKSSFLLSLIYQDIVNGASVTTLDPHSDLVSDLLSLLVERDVFQRDPDLAKRIIYLDPAGERVIPLNVLAIPGDPYEIATAVIEALKRAWSETLSAAPNFENNALYSLMLLIKTRRTLLDLPRVWADTEFRDRLLEEAGDRDIVSFFHDRVDRWGDREAALKIESLLNKSTALTINPYLRLMLGQRECLNFRSIMDDGYILLADLGRAGEETQRLVGSLITTFLEQAVMTRFDLPPEKRRPHYLYIDEFQGFTATDGSVKTMSKILSESRKMGLHLIMANQHLGQLSPRMRSAIMGNVWTKVIFGISEEDAYEFSKMVALGHLDPMAIKREAQTETQHPIYQSIPDQLIDWAAMLARQQPRQAMVRDHRGISTSIWTLSIERTPPASKDIRRELLCHHGIPRSEAGRRLATAVEDVMAPPVEYVLAA